MRVPYLPTDELEADAIDYFTSGGQVDDTLALSRAISLKRIADILSVNARSAQERVG